jgi:hypothetical protein
VIPGEGGTGADAPEDEGLNTQAKVAVHVLNHGSRGCTKSFPVIMDCSDIIATCPGNDVDFFPVFFNLVEYQGFEYSVEWPGTYSCNFISCSYSTIGSIVWPAGAVPPETNQDWIGQAWEECQPHTIAIPGWGWIFEPGPATIRIVACTSTYGLYIGDCRWPSGLNQPVCYFAAGIGGALGDEPCGPSTIENTTWGGIKAIFK